ncbi:MAG: outer membrane beta-barrel protein [Chryseolinea sp.]
MKSQFLLPVLLIVLFFSQNTFAQGSEIELQIVPSVTTMRGNRIVEDYWDPALRVSAGMGFNHVFRNQFLLKAAVAYDNKGTRGSYTGPIHDQNNSVIGTETVEYRQYFQYITVPLQYGRRFGSRVKYDAALGMYGSFLLNSNVEAWSPRYHTNENYTDIYKKFDFGVSVSFSAYVPLRDRLSMKLGIQDNLGLANIAETKVVDNGSIKHNSLGLQVGLNLRLADL